MPSLELFDETLDINSTENYVLSVQAGINGFSFCILDTLRNKFVLIRHFEPDENKYFNIEKLNEIITNDDFLAKKYKRIHIITPSPKFTLVPAPLYEPGKKDEYFTFNHSTDNNSIILSNNIPESDTFVIFSLTKSVNDLLTSCFPGVQYFHHIKPLLRHITYPGKNLSGKYIHVHVEREFFNIIVFDQNDLILCNSFNHRNISDILYYVLNVFKRLDIKQEETIYFSGQTEKYDDLTSNFSIYVRDVKFAEPTGNFSFSYVFNELELHRFLNLFTVINCE
jgi:hypothetical protein